MGSPLTLLSPHLQGVDHAFRIFESKANNSKVQKNQPKPPVLRAITLQTILRVHTNFPAMIQQRFPENRKTISDVLFLSILAGPSLPAQPPPHYDLHSPSRKSGSPTPKQAKHKPASMYDAHIFSLLLCRPHHCADCHAVSRAFMSEQGSMSDWFRFGRSPAPERILTPSVVGPLKILSLRFGEVIALLNLVSSS